jgi:hypothetical protein
MSLEQFFCTLERELTPIERHKELLEVYSQLRVQELVYNKLREGYSRGYSPKYSGIPYSHCTREQWDGAYEKVKVLCVNDVIRRALYGDEERRRGREGLKPMVLEEYAAWNLEVEQKLAAMSPEEREAEALAVGKAAAAAEGERRARREEEMSSFHGRPPGQPSQAPPTAAKEKRAKRENPHINNRPLSPEEQAARVAAAKARRAAITPEGREAAERAAMEERQANQAAAAVREKDRIEKMPTDFRARYLADKAKVKKLMAEERARLDRLAAKKRSSE